MEPLHLSVARAFVGLQEVPGVTSNPAIVRWARDIGAPAWFDNDDKAWCAIWMNRILMACQVPLARGKKTPPDPYDLMRAASFEVHGSPLDHPVLGALLTFKRPEGGHVGLYVGERADAYYVLGANQGNSVSMAWVAKNRLTAVRWPAGVPFVGGDRILLTDDGKQLSTNEA